MSVLEKFRQYNKSDVVTVESKPVQQEDVTSIQTRTDDISPESISMAGAVETQDSELGRTFLQGLTYGFADEIEAFARSSLYEDRPYEEIRDEIRSKISKYQQENPSQAITVEMIGAVAPTVALMFTPGGQATAATKTASLVGRGFTGGSIAGAGYTEAETLGGQIVDTAVGGVTGMFLNPLTQKLGGLAGGKLDKTLNWMRSKFGDRPSDAAVAEIQRLAKSTGKSVDDIVQDIADGKILAENKTLAASVRAIYSKDVTEAGGSAAKIGETLTKRQSKTMDKALKQTEEVLMPGATSRNVFEEINAADDILLKAETKGYKNVFNSVDEVSDNVAKRIESLVQTYPKLAKELEKYTNQANLVPIFKTTQSGTIQLVKKPSLEQADVLYRLMRDEGGALWQAGKGTTAKPLTDATKSFKTLLDDTYPDLAAVRKEAARRLGGKESFKQGRKAFGMDADELEFMFKEMTPDAQKNFRAGVLAAFRNKARRSPTSIGKAADLDKQEAQVLKIVAGDDYEKVLQKQLEIAGESKEAVNRILYGSMTQPQAAAEKAIGSNINVGDVMRAFQGDPIAITAAVSASLAKKGPKLTPKQYEEVTDFLLSNDPNFVKNVLNDTIDYGNISQKISQIMEQLSRVSGKGATKVGAGGVVENIPTGSMLERTGLFNYFSP